MSKMRILVNLKRKQKPQNLFVPMRIVGIKIG